MSVFLTPDPRAVLRRHVLSARPTATACPAFRACSPRWPMRFARGAARSSSRRSCSPATSARSSRCPSGTLDPERRQLDAAADRIGASFDAVHGGFGGAPKFPAPMQLEFLLRAWHRSGDPATLEMVTRTLDAMADGGICDQLGGGFARYSTDARWLVPHFEKMLYDNALLAHAYLEGYRATGDDRYARVARDTLDFMLAELLTDDGGFASALDADSEGVEGRFYVWGYDEFMAVLTDAGLDDDERRLLAAYWGITEPGNWEGTNILHRPGRAEATPELVERGRAALLAARSRRTRPARDDKQLAAWNGLALRALAHATLVLGEPRHADATRRLTTFIGEHLVRDGDRLWRTARDGRAHTPAFCEDYLPCRRWAAGSPCRARRGRAAAARAEAGRQRASATSGTPRPGTFVDTSDEHDRTVARPRGLVDNARTGREQRRRRRPAAAGAADRRGGLRRVAPGRSCARCPLHSSASRAPSDACSPPRIGRWRARSTSWSPARRRRRSRHASCARRRLGRTCPISSLASVQTGDPHAAWPLFAGKVARDGAAMAYACRGYACDEPTADPVAAGRAGARRSARQEAELNGPPRVVRVRVEQRDRLPRSERHAPADHRHGQRGRDEAAAGRDRRRGRALPCR